LLAAKAALRLTRTHVAAVSALDSAVDGVAGENNLRSTAAAVTDGRLDAEADTAATDAQDGGGGGGGG